VKIFGVFISFQFDVKIPFCLLKNAMEIAHISLKPQESFHAALKIVRYFGRTEASVF
jgi:hypothetical protein